LRSSSLQSVPSAAIYCTACSTSIGEARNTI